MVEKEFFLAPLIQKKRKLEGKIARWEEKTKKALVELAELESLIQKNEKLFEGKLPENKIYVDASYDWKLTKNGRGVGLICLVVNDEEPIVKEIELCFPGLRQLINRFELTAIVEASNILKERNVEGMIYSDSQVAVGWARKKKKIINVSWVRRENNLAGIILDSGKYHRILGRLNTHISSEALA